MNIHLRDEVERERTGRLRYRLSSFGNDTSLPYFQGRRSTFEQRVLVPLTSREVILPSLESRAADETDTGIVKEDRNGLFRQLDLICDAVPSIGGALDTLPGSLQLSGLAQAAGDATYSERLAVGSIHDQRGRRRVGVIATAAGPTGTRLRLDLLEKHTFMTSTETQSREYVSWKIASGRTGWWESDDRTPIRQICFSKRDGEYGQFLVVRLESTIAILRPEHRYNAVTYDGRLKPAKRNMPPSVFNPRPFAKLNAKQLMDNPFAHAAFHPRQPQLALIDIEGHWAVWNLTYKHKTDSTIQLPPQRATSQVLGEDKRERKPSLPRQHDGWGRIAWTSDGNFIATARRRNAAFWHLNGSEYRELLSSDLRLVGSERLGKDWILEIKPCPLRPSSLWILTSQKVVSLSVTKVSVVMNQARSTGRIAIDLVKHHHQPQENVTLALELMQFESTIMAVVHGKQNMPAWSHTFQVSQTVSGPKLLAGTPGTFRLGSGNTNGSLTGIGYVPVIRSSEKIKDSFPSSQTADGNLVGALLCSETLGVSESLLSFQHQSIKRLPPVQITARSRSSSVASGKSVEDDFVVPDGMVSDDPEELLPDHVRHASVREPRPRSQQNPCDWRWLRETIEEHSNQKGTDETDRFGYQPPTADHSSSLRLQDVAEYASRGTFDISPGNHVLSDLLGQVGEAASSDHFQEILRGLLQNTFEGITTANDLDRAATLSTSLVSMSGLSSLFTSPFENAPFLRGAIRRSNLAVRPAALENREDLAQGQAHDSATKALLSLHRLAVTIPPDSLSKQGSVQGNVAKSIEMSEKPNEPPSSPISSLPPLPPSDDLYQPDLSLLATSATPHPYSTLASLGVIGAVDGPVTALNRIRDQWKVGEEPTGFNWKLSETALQEQTRPSTARSKTTKKARRDERTLHASSARSASARLGSPDAGSSQATLSQPTFSQPPSSIAQSMRRPPPSIPPSSQVMSSQVSLGTNSQVIPSKAKLGKKRKAGF